MGVLLAVRNFEEFKNIFIYWRPACAVGISGGLASIGWFSAFTLQNASYVRALGQIELVFTFVLTVFLFREKVSRAEIIGITLIMGSIVLLLLRG
jgi:drug/metabolite transporter (DMT)-like permease